MTTGASGTYSINNTDLTLQPTEGRWIERDNLGFDGQGHPIYPAKRNFEITWVLESQSDLSQVINFYNTVGNTGTVVFCLPEWGANEYRFKNYSGCTLSEPTIDPYFMGYSQSVRLVIHNIQT